MWKSPVAYVILKSESREEAEKRRSRADMVNFGNDWNGILKDEFEKEYYIRLREFLIREYRTEEVYPPMEDIFNALKYSSYNDTKVVIIGQDPYHQPGQAHGLCFSVNKGVRIPPSLVNIYKEIKNDLGIETGQAFCNQIQ